MKRRKFTKTIATGLALSNLPIATSIAKDKSFVELIKINKKIKTSDGLQLKLLSHIYPTNKHDEKQFILTYYVENLTHVLKDKIYKLKLENKLEQQVYMTVVGKNQLQAVFNTRLNG